MNCSLNILMRKKGSGLLPGASSGLVQVGFSECGNQLPVDAFPRIWKMLLDI